MPEVLNEIVTPIGTLEELEQINANPFKVRSCHIREKTADGTILGCAFFRQCRFRPWRDQMVKPDGTRLKGPLNVGVEIALAQVDGGAMGQMEMACYDYYRANIRSRQKQQEESGELIRIVAYEGDGKNITEVCTRHVDSDPKSPVMERYNDVHPVRAHKRPLERFPVAAAVGESKRMPYMDDVEREALAGVMSAHGLSGVGPKPGQEEAKMPVVGEGKKVAHGKTA